MPLSVTVTYPMPQAVLPQTFNVCGTYIVNEIDKDLRKHPDRNVRAFTNPVINVTVTKGNVSFGPFTAYFCDDGSSWEAAVSGIGADTGYTVTATITQGGNMVSHAVEWVDVEMFPPLPIVVICCGMNPPAPPAHRVTLLPAGTVRKPVLLGGTHTYPGADDIFGVPWELHVVTTTTPISGGGTHTHHRYRQGHPLPGKYGTLKAGGVWDVNGVEVNDGTFIVVYLKSRGRIVAHNSSPLY